jgi:hypothetical protein
MCMVEMKWFIFLLLLCKYNAPIDRAAPNLALLGRVNIYFCRVEFIIFFYLFKQNINYQYVLFIFPRLFNIAPNFQAEHFPSSRAW